MKRTAKISAGGTNSDPISMGDRVTPQVSVLSPFLFNLALINLPAKRRTVPNLRFTFYADDITL
ncbi:hypothetical protein HPB49_013699 [Dermacentor silvarum]|uniref:Uncharacterized protein n=1 Tax=Dermacentor silvarum TaxID=543639 RepID=A0ACB8E1I2_DERSI|nr:hypothetical protein HPB49_013699 [Dermacentor silvarum]